MTNYDIDERDRKDDQAKRDSAKGIIDDQEDIKRIKNKSKPSLASILHELKGELKSHNDLLAVFQAQDWKDEDEFITLGWVEGLEFAIKLIEEHNRSCEADQ
jgi:hypothetical protein